MARFYVGQRVKKARGEAIGITGTVCAGKLTAENIELGCDFVLIPDQSGVTPSGHPFHQGHPAAAKAWMWEPLTPPHEACDADFKAELDELLARQPATA